MIVNIRGASGSGKSTLVKMFRDYMGGWEPILPAEAEARRAPSLRELAGFESTPAPPAGVTPEGYLIRPSREVGWETRVIGKYGAVLEGCDTIGPAEVCTRVRRYADFGGHVLYEGMIMSNTFGRYGVLADELKAAGYTPVFLFLDTPLDLCIDRQARRRSIHKASVALASTKRKWSGSRSAFERFQNAGHQTEWLDHRDPFPRLLELLKMRQP